MAARMWQRWRMRSTGSLVQRAVVGCAHGRAVRLEFALRGVQRAGGDGQKLAVPFGQSRLPVMLLKQ